MRGVNEPRAFEPPGNETSGVNTVPTSDSTSKIITIQLTRNYSTIIDKIDADLVEYKWYAKTTTCYQENTAWAARNIRVDKKRFTVLMHRVILERILGRKLDSADIVDHIDRNPLNNTRENLRLATYGQNRANSPMNRNNKTGFKGVVKYKNRYHAQIRVNKKVITVGSFKTPEEAHEAYKQAAIKYHGEFARF